jgi:hypothetical protein
MTRDEALELMPGTMVETLFGELREVLSVDDTPHGCYVQTLTERDTIALYEPCGIKRRTE